ncbi:hypothetical protein INT47_010627 [Mucor saturninus]|uniref:Uncharacterized protein n=1 Tax=Mucor saturninus TaxID=64648 RepID=A0A8H7UYX2_9FUNG|nr:hypothetical protein INT47_010627 [Mucor saturninus]
MNKNKIAFPPKDDDPFNGPATEEPSLLWPSSTDTPRWHLLTDQEQRERDQQIGKLESKLKRLDQKKDKSIRKYTNEILPDVTYLSSDSEAEDSHVDEEGLPLLWKNRLSDLEQIPRKTEDQFKSPWWSLFNCCCS